MDALGLSMNCVESRVFSLPAVVFPIRPRLLVSVRNVTEARAAMDGGADVIDVKEPSAGSLGRAANSVMRDVAVTVNQTLTMVSSVALGELQEILASREAISIPAGVRWVKMGLSGCKILPDWQRQWLDLRSHMESAAEWIAVAYVDAEAANAPPVRDVLRAAIATECAGFLLDTFSKADGTLLDHLPVEEVTSITREAQAANLLVALAGRVQRADLPQLIEIQPDLIAVRSAVCRNHDRTAAVDAALVAEFRQAMRATSIAAR